ncbi:MAG: phosphoribosylamine--glycine ligase [Kiritimatiellia bacterium]|jgi:phosphoribosylamine--glycine ligase|nr:phosphoribosylamine--glycine ligase [Kiritimatiellia bacterium]
MNILVIGGGGREHALAWRLAQDSCRPTLFCAPGNAGTAPFCTNLPLAAEDLDGLTAWAREHRPDLTVVGPEIALCLGITDALEAEGLRVFGPCRAAARMEGSKVFAKEVMRAAGVPTARSASFRSSAEARAALDGFALPVVIKADGLAAGKGVIIAQTRQEAETAIGSMLDAAAFGKAGAEVLIEEFLEGEEASILALVDGEHAVLLPSSQDHKRVFDGDRGPNTGGMGAYSPAPVVTPDLLPVIRDTVILPVVRELKRRGIIYQGVLYAGLMIGPQGIRVLEFNARFGDPETQAVLPRLGGDLIPALEACIDGTLNDSLLTVRPEAAATVILASGGYPGEYRKGLPLSGLDQAAALDDVLLFHAGTALRDGRVVTAGGRVLAVTALGADLRAAVGKAYGAVAKIHFEGAHSRTDIAHRAFNRSATCTP